MLARRQMLDYGPEIADEASDDAPQVVAADATDAHLFFSFFLSFFRIFSPSCTSTEEGIHVEKASSRTRIEDGPMASLPAHLIFPSYAHNGVK